MLSYYLKCRKSTESKNPKAEKKKTDKIMLPSNYAACDSRKIEIC